MGCMLLLLEYYGLSRRTGRGCHHDNEVAKGAGTKECACNEPGACMFSGGGARAYARARGGGGGGRPSIMVCPLRGNYAESCVSVGGGGYYGMSGPFVCLWGC